MTHLDNEPTDTLVDAVAAARAWSDLIAERDLTASEHQRFVEWLGDGDHELEFFTEFNIRFSLREARQSEHQAPHAMAAHPIPPRYITEQRLWTRPRLALAAAVALLGIGIAWIGLPRHSHYSTGMGEKLTANLADGTRVDLNAQTELEWLGARKCDRRVRLAHGEALFNVQRDPHCPFHVLVGHDSIEVLGTEFDVYQRHNGDLRVSVLEGRVRIHGIPVDAASPPWQIELVAGQQATWSTGLPSTRKLDDASKAIAWREDRLDFDDQPLEQVVEELQRYTSIPIRIMDPRLVTIHVTGELSVDQPHIRASVLRLAQRPEIQVDDRGNSLRLTYREQAPATSEGQP